MQHEKVFPYEKAVMLQQKVSESMSCDQAIETMSIVRHLMHLSIDNNNILPEYLTVPPLVAIDNECLGDIFHKLGYHHIHIQSNSRITLININ